MMKTKLLLMLSLISFGWMACMAQPADKNGFTTLPSGLQYKITQKGSGKSPKPGDKITAHYTGKLTNDTVFDSSVKRGTPFQFKLGKGQVIKGWDEGFALLKKGEKATFIIPPGLAYGSMARGKIPADATLIFDVELIDFQEPVVPKVFDVKGKDTVKTASGLKYIMVKKNDAGAKTESGKKVMVHYSGYLPDGKMFDSSVEREQPLPFILGQGQVIKGWDEGILLLKEGEQARLIIPYTLGYGEGGRPPVIPPATTLIFDVEIIKAVVQ
jgi:peptidylprolyl isomerase